MAINLADNNPRVVYTVAEGATQTAFSVPFEFFEDADVNIYVDGVLKSEGTDYTLTGGEGATGTLTFVTANPGDPQQVTGAVGDSTVVLVRRIAIERTTDFQQGMDISRSALNSQLDVLTALVADMNDRWDRAVHLDDADTGQVNFILPSSSLRAGNYFAFDANGDPVMTTGTTSDIIVSAFAETFLDDNDATQFFTTMGVTSSAAELNILDGVTATAAELNFTDGVTSNIQTQLDAKALQSTTIATGTGLTGGGDLSASRTISPDIASQAEAEAGTASNKLMTPLRTAQAIAALAPDPATVTRTLIYNGTSTATVESSDFEDGYYYRFIFDGVGQDGSNGAHYLAMDFMKQSNSAYVGSLYSSYLPVGYAGGNNPRINGVVTVHMPRVDANHFSVSANIDMTTGNTTAFTAGTGATSAHAMGGRVYVGATETKIKRVRFWVTDPATNFRNITSGKIYQEKIKSV